MSTKSLSVWAPHHTTSGLCTTKLLRALHAPPGTRHWTNVFCLMQRSTDAGTQTYSAVAGQASFRLV
jgi:hypothetical protein